MRHFVNPRQNLLFDPAETLFSPMAIRYFKADWPGLFRSQLLAMMPAKELGERFDPIMGTPTKELYSMAGAIFLKEYFNMTIEDAVYHYVVDPCWHYALNINPTQASMSHASIERYSRYIREEELAQTIFDRVTGVLIEVLELDVSRQRLDSTHIFSDMAIFGRTKLMGVCIKRFLTQLKRKDPALFDSLPEELRQRYGVSQAKLFGDHQGTRQQLRQQVAEDVLSLVSRFADHADIVAMTTYKALQRDLQSPVSGVTPSNADLTIDDFVIDLERQVVERCPAGHEPLSSQYDSQKDQTITEMNSNHCSTCEFVDQCPVNKGRGRYTVKHTGAQHRLASRRAEQSTEAFSENYAIRGGGESVNSGLKRKTGMGRLRVRGRPAMELGVLLRCAGWNLSRTVATLKKRGVDDFRSLCGLYFGLFGPFGCLVRQGRALRIAAGSILRFQANFVRRLAA